MDRSVPGFSLGLAHHLLPIHLADPLCMNTPGAPSVDPNLICEWL